MGTIIEINSDYVIVQFDDGTKRKYLKENFVYEPVLNRIVQLNNDGTFIDIIRQQEVHNIKVTIIVLIILAVLGFLGYHFVKFAIDVGNDMRSCIESCN